MTGRDGVRLGAALWLITARRLATPERERDPTSRHPSG